jgi:hypothetical protein
MEVPHLVREHLGGEAIEASVSLGDEDVVCVTPSRALVYRGEGLLSDESVEEYALDLERFDLSHGRRKTKFVFEYVDGTNSFTVPGSRADSLLTLLLQGILRVEGVIGENESVAGVYQFSELTLVVAESRLIKHIGSTVWDDDFEVYDYDDVSGLDFKDGSVATQIVITVDGRPQRIKAPNDEAPQVRQTLVQSLCTYYDVASLEQLQGTLAESEDATESEDTAEEADSSGSSDSLSLDEGISPLVGGDAGGDATEEPTDESAPESSAADRTTTEPTPQPEPTPTTSQPQGGQTTRASEPQQTTEAPEPSPESERVDPEDIEAMQEQLKALTKVVKRQNELLEQQDDRIKTHDQRIEQLIDELRRGR